MTQKSQTCIILFAKFPAKGKAKTRLQPVLGSEGAAMMARKLLLHSVEQALATGFAVELNVSPAPSDPCWQTLDLPKSLLWSAQADGDLGMRMLSASQNALDNFEQVLLIGSDCPDLTAERIKDAAKQLEQHDITLIPAFDGGYVLLGFKQVNAQLFSNMTWSVSDVAEVTEQRIKDLRWSLARMKPLPDIDEPKDLQYLPRGWLDDYKATAYND
ncbi:TIGR04282 family arsenosugar biosynthesis glycosyltransferase [Psychrobacter sp. 2Y5]|uniref:TIGR04282 family arsenosugar biosynthesis glycosyltransferase n=1 Tax=unclassified Psychrobacter TaxID=196806 RepID=UPI003F460F18